MEYRIHLSDEAQMRALGEAFALELEPGAVVLLKGDLGSGKTTFAGGVISGLGCASPVVSPTYTLVEEYITIAHLVCHFDLYRLNNLNELEGLGIRDRCDGKRVLLIEWPENGAGALPQAHWEVQIDYADLGRTVCIQGGRPAKAIEAFIAS